MLFLLAHPWIAYVIGVYILSCAVMYLNVRVHFKTNTHIYSLIYSGKNLSWLMIWTSLLPVVNTAISLIFVFSFLIEQPYRRWIKGDKSQFGKMEMLTLHKDGEIREHSGDTPPPSTLELNPN